MRDWRSLPVGRAGREHTSILFRIPACLRPCFSPPSKEMVAVVTPSLPVLLRPVQSGFRLTPSLKSPSLASSVTSALPDPRAPSVLRALCRSAALRHSRPSRNRSFGSHNAPFSWFCPPSAVFFRFLRCLFLLYLTNTHLSTSLGFSPGLSSFLFPLSPGELVHPRGFRWIHLNADQSEFLSLIMEVKSHRQPPTASRLAQGKLRPHLSPDTHLSSPGSGHVGPAARVRPRGSSPTGPLLLFQQTARFCSGPSNLLFHWLPHPLRCADLASGQTPAPPVRPHPGAFGKPLTLFITQRGVSSVKTRGGAGFVPGCVAPSPTGRGPVGTAVPGWGETGPGQSPWGNRQWVQRGSCFAVSGSISIGFRLKSMSLWHPSPPPSRPGDLSPLETGPSAPV